MVVEGGAVYMTRTSSQILRRVRRRINIVEGRRWIEMLNHMRLLARIAHLSCLRVNDDDLNMNDSCE